MRLLLPCVLSLSIAPAAFAGGANVFVSNAKLNAPDLTPLARINATAGQPQVKLIVDGRPTLPIVVGKNPPQRVLWAAEFIADSIAEMTGSRPEILKNEGPELRSDKPGEGCGPAIYIGSQRESLAKAKLSAKGFRPGEFAVRTLNGSVYLYGNDDDTTRSTGSAFAALDFAERVLDVREYFDPKAAGRTTVPTSNLTAETLDYRDAPVYEKRDLWPYSWKREWFAWRLADTHPVQLMVHAPHSWGKDPETYRKTRPEIFALEKDGTRTLSPMLCYSNPKTLQTYLERIDEELAGGRKSGILNGKAVTVSPWDMGVNCQCADCRRLFDAVGPDSGSASKILCAFVRKLSDELATRHPELTVIYLPYMNYCDIPDGTTFPAKNVEVQLCTMPGLAMLKDARVKKHEEDLIKAWSKVTGRKIQNWHYICWPAEFTNAPYVFAEAAIQHYRDIRPYCVGSFINGGYPEQRLLLSAWVWSRALWNPDLDAAAVYDQFAKRLFGPAARPLRRIIQLQVDGWNKDWVVAKVSPKNIYQVSYPRPVVQEMEKCFDEAYRLAENDETSKRRLDYYRKGFEQFFKESTEQAEGTAFAPLLIKKAAENPSLDGKLDDAAWKSADPLSFIRARDKDHKECKYPTTVQAVWTPDGITFGFRMTEPTPHLLYTKDPAGSWHNDNVEAFFDVTGQGAGDFFQIILDARNEDLLCLHAAESGKWRAEGTKSHVFRGQDFWSAELFVPFNLFTKVNGAQVPKTSSAGLFWLGNFTRHRKCDCDDKAKTPGSERELQRLNTRYSPFSADQSAFGVLKFVE
jgi:hypothetical protein